MRRTEFTTELKNNLDEKDFLILRTLYTPVIGKDAVMLYSLLFDYYNLSKNNGSFYSFNDLAITLGLSEEDLILERRKLEAVGLVRTFEKADNIHFIIKLNQPLSASQFRNNVLLYKSAISKIGELMFERIEFSTKFKELAKDDFSEVSVKYQDMFSMEMPVENNISSTLEIALPSVKSKEEGISGLTAPQFVYYLTGNKVSPSQLTTIQQIQNNGFSSKSINLIIDYSFEINDSIVSAHIRTIANDMLKKDIKDAKEIENELNAARASRKTVIKAERVTELENADSNENWEDLFKNLGGAF